MWLLVGVLVFGSGLNSGLGNSLDLLLIFGEGVNVVALLVCFMVVLVEGLKAWHQTVEVF